MAEEVMDESTLDFEGVSEVTDYTGDDIRHLEWDEHIRLRPGMYIGKVGDGSAHDDGIYILLKEIIDNCIDEFVMGFGRNIDISIEDGSVTVRDYGRGIPLEGLRVAVGEINTGAKYNTSAFKKAVGLNGVGSKAVNAMSSSFIAQSFRAGLSKKVEFSKGKLVSEGEIVPTDEKNGTLIKFTPDKELFGNYHFLEEYVDDMIWNYAFLNSGLVINYNEQKYQAKNGLYDLL